MTLNQNRIFLLDAVGASMSSVLLGGVLPALQPWIGMPRTILYLLAGWAVLFAVYSLCCHSFVTNTQKWLRILVIANAVYCAFTLSLVIYYSGELLVWGTVYFVLELIVILGIVALETQVLRKL